MYDSEKWNCSLSSSFRLLCSLVREYCMLKGQVSRVAVRTVATVGLLLH